MPLGFNLLGVGGPAHCRRKGGAPVVSIGGPACEANIAAGSYEIDGSAVTYADVFLTSHGYGSYGDPFVVTPGVGIVTETTGTGVEELTLADTLNPTVGDQFLDGYVIVVEMEVSAGAITDPLSNVYFFLIGEITDETTRDTAWQWAIDVWSTDYASTDLTYVLRVSDFADLFNEQEIADPAGGVIRIAARLAADELAISVNGGAPLTGVPQANPGANCVGFRGINTTQEQQGTMIIKSMELFSHTDYATADLATLSAL